MPYFAATKEVDYCDISCSICSSAIAYRHSDIDQSRKHLNILVCPQLSCLSTFHIECLAGHLLVEEQLVPTIGKCPICHTKIYWDMVIRNAFWRSDNFTKGSWKSDEDNSTEFDDVAEEFKSATTEFGLEFPAFAEKESQNSQNKNMKAPMTKSHRKTKSTSNVKRDINMVIPDSEEENFHEIDLYDDTLQRKEPTHKKGTRKQIDSVYFI